MAFSQETYEKMAHEVAKFPPGEKRSAAVAVMAIVQEETRWLSSESMQEIADYLGVPFVVIAEIASFYSMFDIRPVGRYKITVCGSLPCDLAGSGQAAQHLQSRLGIGFGETTPDGRFTLARGECMGACGEGPVLLVNNRQMYVRMTPDRIDRLLEELGK
ncbi:MAG: NAD(P)H-dependent oxidoreductase subunit E [Oxalobacter formigenes]|nr:NAD(P)H-dependent oxidoreductase subunit E [Oxalobacter formigenes]